jgi:hypothetical protein
MKAVAAGPARRLLYFCGLFWRSTRMSQNTERHPITMKKVVYEIPGMRSVMVRRDEPYRVTDAGPLTMDCYYPPDPNGTRVPAVVVVLGYPPKEPNPLGCTFKEMEWSISWGQLIAASGIAAIFYTNREPEADLRALLQHVRENAAPLGIDEQRIGLLATSGNAPLALSALMEQGRDRLKCAVLCYPMTLDVGGATAVAESAAKWGFVNAAAGRSVRDLPQDLPLFIARAGRDEFPGLNDTMNGFLAEAFARNLPVSVVNHADAPHAFDLLHDSEATREIIRQMLRFMQFHLQG